MEMPVSQIAISEMVVGKQSINQLEWGLGKVNRAVLASTLEAVTPGISFD